MPERTYSQEDAAEVFRQAADIQRAESGVSGGTLTLDELRSAGVEAGLSPTHVERAARGEGVQRSRALGAPRGIRLSRYVEGLVTDETWGTLVADLRRAFETPGSMETSGAVRSWSGKSADAYPVQAVLEPEGPGHRVTVEFSYAGWTQLVVVLGAMAAAVSMLYWGAFLSGAPAEWLPTIVGALNPIAAVLAFGLVWYARREVRELERKITVALDRAAAPAGRVETAGALLPDRPALDLDSDAILPEEGSTEGPTRVRS